METKFIARQKSPGSTMRTINVDRGGLPFGQIWYFREPRCESMFHAKCLHGAYDAFVTLNQAKEFMRRS